MHIFPLWYALDFNLYTSSQNIILADQKTYNHSARLKTPLPGSRTSAKKYLKDMEYLKRKGDNADDPIHIDIPVHLESKTRKSFDNNV